MNIKQKTTIGLIGLGITMAALQFSSNTNTSKNDEGQDLKVIGATSDDRGRELQKKVMDEFPLLVQENIKNKNVQDSLSRPSQESKHDLAKDVEYKLELLKEFKKLKVKILRNKTEEQLYKDSLNLSANIDAFSELLSTQSLSQIKDPHTLRMTYINSVDFLVDALSGAGRDHAILKIQDILKNPDIENKSLDSKVREVAAQTKALLAFYAYKDLEQVQFDLEKNAPGPATVKIMKNVIDTNKVLENESKRLVAELSSSKQN